MLKLKEGINDMKPTPLVSPAPTPAIGSEVAFIDSEGVYQECTIRSIYDGYAWVQKTEGKMNTVPVGKIISRKSESERAIEEMTKVCSDLNVSKILSKSLQEVLSTLYLKGYRQSTPLVNDIHVLKNELTGYYGVAKQCGCGSCETCERLSTTGELLHEIQDKYFSAPEWPESDERINNIGQNGNNGDHYEQS